MQTADLPQRANAFAATAGQNAFVESPTARVPAPACRTRRAARIAASLPIEVRDQFGGREETRTQFLMVRGAVIATSSTVRVGHKLTIQNLKNGRIAECHVISVEPVLRDVHQAEVEFTRPQSDFWPVQFPADELKANENSTSASSPTSSVHEVDLRRAFTQESSAGLETEKTAASAKHDDQIVSLADALTENFNPPSAHAITERYSSRTATLDSVAQFRAANRAAHRREQQMKVFYTCLSILVLAGAIIGGRAWMRRQPEKPVTSAPAAAQLSAFAPAAQPAVTSQQTAATTAPVLAATTAPTPATIPEEQNQAAANASTPAQTLVPEIKPEDSQVAVRHGALSAALKKPRGVEEEAPIAMPLRADDATARPDALNSIVAPVSGKNPILAPQAPKKVTSAQLLRSVPAQYPSMARQLRAEGQVLVEIDIDTNGEVANAKVLSGPPLLRNAALEAVHKWKYQPAMVGDKPVSTSENVKIDFHLH